MACRNPWFEGCILSVRFALDNVRLVKNPWFQGCIELLDRYGVEIAGKRAVVLGRSNIVGIPVSMLLMHRDATVTMTHSKTVDIASVVSDLL